MSRLNDPNIIRLLCVCVVRPAVHGDRIHGERRPQHVPVTAGDREHADTRQQHPFSQVNTPYTLFLLFIHANMLIPRVALHAI